MKNVSSGDEQQENSGTLVKTVRRRERGEGIEENRILEEMGEKHMGKNIWRGSGKKLKQ